ncbi:SUN domain-containing protein 2-like [Cucumis melo var. makuwa]|uniref:SUN domain-containing protein 2-like n=1 Tax=Cucumis melo var. makuwa TaxID=1194695 RepID=A0A5A7TLY6_CUCMM|nr:SUN domain-containing protein 2-like [Cucumis melo var. makuwa]
MMEMESACFTQDLLYLEKTFSASTLIRPASNTSNRCVFPNYYSPNLWGSWACCKFSRMQAGGIPYQELEMAVPESSSA